MTPTPTLGSSHRLRLSDGRHLHHQVLGDGPVTVVLESGMGMSRAPWGLVAPALAAHARVVTYDRAGTGRSDDDPAPRTLDRLVADLDALLRHLGPGPFVLVGHSWGGPVVRLAAALDPGRVAGLVLVDPTDEGCELYFGDAARRRFAMTRALVPVARTGLYRLAGARPGRHLPDDVAAEHRRTDFTVRAARTMVAEVATCVDDLERLRTSPPDLGDLPVTIVSGTRTTRLDRTVRTAVVAAHRRSAAALAGGRHVDAPGSAHLVMLDDAPLVVEEVVRLLPR